MLKRTDGKFSRTQIWNSVGMAAGILVFVMPDLQQFLVATFKDQPGYAGLVIAGIKGVDFYFRTITSQGVK